MASRAHQLWLWILSGTVFFCACSAANSSPFDPPAVAPDDRVAAQPAGGSSQTAGGLDQDTAATAVDRIDNQAQQGAGEDGILSDAEGKDRLDYGLYWLGPDQLKQKWLKGRPNAYYDPSKPVVIFIHGLQSGKTQNNYDRDDLYWDTVDLWTHNTWLAQGWNVGIFYWNQWADEDLPWDAEAKIWSIDGPQGMRYRLLSGEYSNHWNPGQPCGELAYESYREALAGFNGGVIRLVGHSLGSQLAIRLAQLIAQNIEAGNLSARLMVRRLTLLDPTWISGGREYLGDADGDGDNDWTGERSRWAVQQLLARWQGVNGFCVEIYNTTPLDQGLLVTDKNDPLRRIACTTVSLTPRYYGALEFQKKHKAAFFHYFWSMGFAPPVQVERNGDGWSPLGQTAPSAATPDWRLGQMLITRAKWVQQVGQRTPSPADDGFEQVEP